MPKQEILPPLRNAQVTVARPQSAIVTVAVPGERTGGYVQSALNEWRWRYTAKAVDSLTRLNNAEAALYNAQTAVVEATIKKREALAKLPELPEKLDHELAVRRVERADRFREAQHSYEMNEARRATERTKAETEHTHARAEFAHARTVLTDAEQQLNAQRKHGELNYEIAHAKKNLELLDVQLSAEERRALMHKQLREIEAGGVEPLEDEVDELYQRVAARPK